MPINKVKMLKIQKLDLLVAFYTAFVVLSELMGAKTFPLLTIGSFHLNSSVAIFIFPLIFTINDIVVEVYGKERAVSLARSGLLVVFFVFIFSLVATSLPPSARFSDTEKAYDQIFQASARISAASLIAFLISQFTDIFIFVKMRERLGKKGLWFRNNVSNFISQFLDTTVFITLAFYALNRSLPDNFGFLFGLILPYWLLKCFMSAVETPLVYLGVRWLRGDSHKWKLLSSQFAALMEKSRKEKKWG